jgi:hypothetical protein
MRKWIREVMVTVALLMLLLVALLLFITQPVFTNAPVKPTSLADVQRLRSDVEFLTKEPHRRSYPRVAELDRAADYIHKQFAAAGARVSEQTYAMDGDTYRNVIASFGPEVGERIIVGAHYDSYGGMPGADDNASGTAGVLELVRLLAKVPLQTRVDLVAFTIEEPPIFRSEYMGSMRHAKALHDAGVKLKGMICLEMIGYFSDAPNSQQYPFSGLNKFYSDRGDFIALVGGPSDVGLLRRVKRGMLAANSLPLHSINAPGSLTGIDFSDHWSYWQYGYSAVMITDTAFYRNERYHSPADTADSLDYHRMGQVVDKVLFAVRELAP